MAIERTFSILKPDATRRNLTGKINAKFEDAGLSIVAQRRIQMTTAQAESFYGVHRERGFFRANDHWHDWALRIRQSGAAREGLCLLHR